VTTLASFVSRSDLSSRRRLVDARWSSLGDVKIAQAPASALAPPAGIPGPSRVATAARSTLQIGVLQIERHE
jgi:hypothetical protein